MLFAALEIWSREIGNCSGGLRPKKIHRPQIRRSSRWWRCFFNFAGDQHAFAVLGWVCTTAVAAGHLIGLGALLFWVRSGVAPLPGPTAFKDFLGLARKSFGAVSLVPISPLI
ncbi:hypothetical protein Ancab_019282 [Ancistrocladus abbreviatus]